MSNEMLKIILPDKLLNKNCLKVSLKKVVSGEKLPILAETKLTDDSEDQKPAGTGSVVGCWPSVRRS